MTTAEQEKRKRYLAIGLGSLAALLVGYQLFNTFGGSSTPPPLPPPVITTTGGARAVPVRGSAAANAAKTPLTGAQLDPSLHMEAMLVTEALQYSGSGRNIFSGEVEAPVLVATNIPAPVGPARPEKKPDPCPPNCPPPPGPVIPPVPFKFFGTATSANGTRRAFLLSTSGDDVVVALAGDIVQRRYRVVSIEANSVLIEDIPNANKQSVPLTKAN
jgi:hypothetical protein